ncbi:hypothetical protein L9F63_010954, partial [Diploptera punctata]
YEIIRKFRMCIPVDKINESSLDSINQSGNFLTILTIFLVVTILAAVLACMNQLHFWIRFNSYFALGPNVILGMFFVKLLSNFAGCRGLWYGVLIIYLFYLLVTSFSDIAIDGEDALRPGGRSSSAIFRVHQSAAGSETAVPIGPPTAGILVLFASTANLFYTAVATVLISERMLFRSHVDHLKDPLRSSWISVGSTPANSTGASPGSSDLPWPRHRWTSICYASDAQLEESERLSPWHVVVACMHVVCFGEAVGIRILDNPDACWPAHVLNFGGESLSVSLISGKTAYGCAAGVLETFWVNC